ncbi:MAG: methyl-accepting chemotaxis protein [Treponema sp.]|nr:methyl-accepting chemotaxis protein [Treponema sp.]
MKLSVKIPLFFGVIIIVVAVSIAIVSIYRSTVILRTTIMNAMTSEGHANAEIISSKLIGQLDVLSEIAARYYVRDMDINTIRTSLVADVARIGASDLAVANTQGVSNYMIDNTSLNIGDRDYFKKALNGEKNIEIVVSRLSGNVVALYAVPIFRDSNPNSPVVGVLIARKDGMMLAEFTNNLDSSMGTGRYYILNEKGTFIAHRNPDYIVAQLNPMEAAKDDNSFISLGNAVSASLNSQSGFVDYVFNGRMMGYHCVINGFPWKLFFAVDTAELNEKVAEIRNAAIGIALILLFGALIAAFIIGRSIAKPVHNVAVTLRDIAEGEGDLTHQIVVKSNDEIGELSKYFNMTLEKIKNLVINIRAEADALAITGDDLASNMNQTAAAVNQITSNIQSVKGRILTQSASVSETHATMEQVTVNIGKLNTHVEHQSMNIAQASSAIEQMVANTRSVTDTLVKNAANVKTLMDSSEIGRGGLHEVAEDIKEIARQSEGLLQINAMMESIASQTNLLSMNAAIEAAHAGEAGRGFAVVAGEIRKLAESSSQQSKTISDVLKLIKESIDKITFATENVLNKFQAIDSSVQVVAQQEDNIRNAMEEQGTGSKQILEGVSNINLITSDVKRSSQEMLEGSTEVIRESENLEKITSEITMGINEMATGAEEINTAVHQVNEITIQNRENIEMLRGEVKRFKVD